MFDISRLKKIKGIRIETAETDNISGNDVKRIRNDIFHMSQTAFALALGVSKKTIEAWERGTNIPSKTAQKLLYLLENNTYLMKQLYNLQDERKIQKVQKYSFELTSITLRSTPSLTKSNAFYGMREEKHGNKQAFFA